MKASELKVWADEVLPVLIDINISITNLRIINVERKNNLHIIGHGFFRYMQSQQKFILVIQLAKLFSNSDNQHFNFIKLCNRLENEGMDESILLKLKENQTKFTDVFRSKKDMLSEIKIFRAYLQNEASLLHDLIILRDKVYAHSDPILDKPLLSHENLEKLVLLASDMYNTLFGKLFDRHFHFRTGDWDLRYIISKLK